MKLLFIDTETTGLWPNKHSVIQIAGTVVDCDAAREQDFNFRCSPLPGSIIDQSALKANNLTEGEIRSYPDPTQVKGELTAILDSFCNRRDQQDKFHMIAYNARFDYDFMREWFNRQGEKLTWPAFVFFPPIDVMNMAAVTLAPVRHTMVNFKLHTTAVQLGIDIDHSRLHEAGYDIEITRKMYNILMKG